MYNTALNINTISHLWKCATIIPTPKPNTKTTLAHTNPYHFYHPLPKHKEKTLLPYIKENIPAVPHQHGFKHKHSTHNALHNIYHQITKGFNNPRSPQCTVTVALKINKVFDTVNIHKLILTNIPNIIIKFIATTKGRQACIQYNGTISKLKRINTGIP